MVKFTEMSTLTASVSNKCTDIYLFTYVCYGQIYRISTLTASVSNKCTDIYLFTYVCYGQIYRISTLTASVSNKCTDIYLFTYVCYGQIYRMSTLTASVSNRWTDIYRHCQIYLLFPIDEICYQHLAIYQKIYGLYHLYQLSMNYLVMCKVYTDVGGIKLLHHGLSTCT